MNEERAALVSIVDSRRSSYLTETTVENEILRSIASVRLHLVDTVSDLYGFIEDADAVISWHTIPITKELLQRLSRCKGIVRAAVGFDNIDTSFAAECGIPIANVPDYGTEEVADHTWALLLGVVRRVTVAHRHASNGEWDWRVIGNVQRLRGSTLGIIGFGRIGSAVARRAHPFGIRVLFYDPYVSEGADKAHGVERCDSLDTLLSQADIISIHAPLTSETCGLIGRIAFSRMKNGVILLNTARGAIIDESAMLDALREAHVAGLGLDVLESEPRVPEGLRQSDRVILTSHSAFFSNAGLIELRRKAALKTKAFLLGNSCVRALDDSSLDTELAEHGTEESHSHGTDR